MEGVALFHVGVMLSSLKKNKDRCAYVIDMLEQKSKSIFFFFASTMRRIKKRLGVLLISSLYDWHADVNVRATLEICGL